MGTGMSRWLSWHGPNTEPAKTTKPLGEARAVGEVSNLGIPPEVSRAMRLLNISGSRIIRTGELLIVGVWEDLDGPELRAAVRSVGMGQCLVVHLESAEVPIRYKVRSCPERRNGEAFVFWLKRAAHSSPSTNAAYPERRTESSRK
jgi:hypothetical protein